MKTHFTFKFMFFALVLLAFGSVIATSAQEQTPDREKVCAEEGMTIYESWIRDIPCTPNILPNEDGYIETFSEDVTSTPSDTILSSADFTYMVYSSYVNGNWEILGTKSPWDWDGISNSTQMTVHPGSDLRPRLQPGSTQIVFSSNRTGNYELYIMDWGGVNLRQLTANGAYDSQAAWSPDGEQITFVSDRAGNQEIYLMQPDGSHLIRLTFDGAADFNPYWSVDGTQIVWVRAVDEVHGVLYVMNADGSNPHPISSPLRYLQHPSWSGNGTLLAFDYDSNGDGWSDLAIISSDGSNLEIIQQGSEYWRCDFWAGPWPGTYIDLLASKLTYILYNGTYYLDNACINEFDNAYGWDNNGCIDGTNYYGYALYPDTASIDISIPKTYVEPLPEFSRASGFPLIVYGTDSGPAELDDIETQYRVETNGEWNTLFGNWEYLIQTNTTQRKEITHQGEPGTTLYFRSQGKDMAEHLEPWPPEDGDTSTTLYLWEFEGNILDNRDYQTSNSSLSISPNPLNEISILPQGKYTAYLGTTGTYTIQASHQGYGELPIFTEEIVRDQRSDLNLPPVDDIIVNGGFENSVQPFVSWNITGTLPYTIEMGHTGSSSALLGFSCGSPCLTPVESVHQAPLYSYPRIAVDSIGQTHIVWYVGGEFYYSMRDVADNWSEPYILGEAVTNIYPPEILIDSNDTVHVIWGGINYIFKQNDGTWSDIENPVETPLWGGYPIVAATVNEQGEVFVIYTDDNPYGMYIVKRLPNKTWEAPIPLAEVAGISGYDIAVGPDGTIHIVFIPDDYIKYRLLLPNGVLSNWETVMESQNVYGSPQISVDTNGTIHLLGYTKDSVRIYTSKHPGEEWASPITLPNSKGTYDYLYDMNVDSEGNVHVVGAPMYDDTVPGVYYYRKASNNDYFNTYTLPTDGVKAGASLAVGHDDSLSFIWPQNDALSFATTPFAKESKWASISQELDIPSDLHQATLSFMAKIHSDLKWNSSNFSANIMSSNEEFPLLEINNEAAWGHQWFDVSAWAGQTISVTFTMNQAADEPYVQLFLDEISLGSWLTPVISDIAPDKSMNWYQNPATITIYGENFMQTPTVYIGDMLALDVHWIDENTLTVVIPAELPPGKYNIVVKNPQGQEALLIGGLQLGEIIYLPATMR